MLYVVRSGWHQLEISWQGETSKGQRVIIQRVSSFNMDVQIFFVLTQAGAAAAFESGRGSIATHTGHSNTPSQANSGRVTYCGLMNTRIADRFKWFFGSGSFRKLLGFFMGP